MDGNEVLTFSCLPSPPMPSWIVLLFRLQGGRKGRVGLQLEA